MAQNQSVPYSSEAEAAVLGCMINDSAALAVAVESLMEQDFYSSVNREIFSTLAEMLSVATPVDIVTLCNALERRGVLKGVGGVSHVTELSLGVLSSTNLKEYIEIVVEKSTLRQLVHAGDAIVKEALAGAGAVQAILEGAQKQIYDISMRKNSDTLMHIRTALMNSYQNVSEMMGRKGELTGTPSGFISLDKKLSGLNNSDLIVVAARPGMGKTSFALNIARHIGVKEQKSVAIFSLEMSREQLALRLLCSEAMVDMQRVRGGDINEEEIVKLSGAMEPLSRSLLYVDDTAGVTVNDIRSKCRRLQMEKGLGLVVIDYLQLMDTGGGRQENRQQEISETTRSLKILARELNVPVILLSQLNRGPESRANHRPMLADLRESGAIEQDADIVLFLYREGVYDENAGNEAEAIIAKHRNGPTGTVKMIWRGEYTRFFSEDTTHYGDEPPPLPSFDTPPF